VAAASQSPQSEQLLDDFFEVCQTPNEAEVAFFSDVTGFDQVQIQEYCKTFTMPISKRSVLRQYPFSRKPSGWTARTLCSKKFALFERQSWLADTQATSKCRNTVSDKEKTSKCALMSSWLDRHIPNDCMHSDNLIQDRNPYHVRTCPT